MDADGTATCNLEHDKHGILPPTLLTVCRWRTLIAWALPGGYEYVTGRLRGFQHGLCPAAVKSCRRPDFTTDCFCPR